MNRRHLATLLLVAGQFLLAACQPSAPAAPSRFAPTGLPPVMPSGDFLAYIDAARAHVALVNQAVGTPIASDDLAAVGPFEIRPKPPGKDCKGRAVADYDKGVLLIHGLNDTPFSMWDLAARFAKACYMVRTVLLPGHGTVPGDLLAVGLPAWRDAVAKAVWSFRGEVDRLVIAGFDLGADLALDAALDLGMPPELELDGIVMLAPAFAYAPPSFAPAAVGPGGDALWGDVFAPEDHLRYNSVAKPAVGAVNRLGRELLTRQAPLQIPLFVVASADDAVADPDLTQRWFCGQETTPRRLLWYTRYPDRPVPNCRCVIRDRDPAKDRAEICAFTRPSSHGTFVDRRAAAETVSASAGIDAASGANHQTILDMSHIALLAAPDNPRYGAVSGRRDCLHYSWERDTPEGLVCTGDLVDEGQAYVRYGEASAGNLRNYIVRRLTYNPDFDHMATAILEFLDEND